MRQLQLSDPINSVFGHVVPAYGEAHILELGTEVVHLRVIRVIRVNRVIRVIRVIKGY